MKDCATYGLSAIMFASICLASGQVAAEYDCSGSDYRDTYTPQAPIYKKYYYVTDGTTYKWELQNLSSGADPVMRLYETGYNQLDVDDDSGEDANAPQISWTADFTGYIAIVVHPYDDGYGGSADLLLNGSTSVSGITFDAGVYQVGDIYPLGSPICTLEDGDHVETMFEAGGAEDHEMIVVQGVNASFGDTNQAEFYNDPRSIYENASGGDQNLTFIYSGRNSMFDRELSVALNDVTDDWDYDGVGADLEYEMGTCDSALQESKFDWDCNGYPTQNTDGDGYTDYDEIFHAKESDSSATFPLRLWGALPSQKDVFIEIDHEKELQGDFVANNVDGDWLRYFQQIYAEGSPEDVHNPNGDSGIRIHMDVGKNVPTDAEYYYDRVPWTWVILENEIVGFDGGGSGRTALDSDGKSLPCGNHGVRRLDSMDESRREFFFYGCVNEASGGGNAQTPGLHFSAAIGKGSNNNLFGITTKAAHEFGHNLGLGHGGYDPSTGDAIGIGSKPNYASIMNFDSLGEFSDVNTNSSINPTSVPEVDVMQGHSTSHLTDPGLYGYTVSGDSVDWNRNGTIDSSPVRAHTNWAPPVWGINGAVRKRFEPSNEPEETPAGTRIEIDGNEYVHMFYPQDGQLDVKYAPYVSGCASTLNEKHLGFGECNLNWSHSSLPDLQYGVKTVSAAVYQVTGDSDPHIFLATKDSDDWVTVRELSVHSNGSINVVDEVSTDDPGATDTPEIYPVGGELMVAWRDADASSPQGQIHHSRMQPDGTWSVTAQPLVDGNGDPVTSGQSPVLAHNRKLDLDYMLVTDTGTGDISLRWHDGGNEWVSSSTYQVSSGNAKLQPDTKPDMVWQPNDRVDAPNGEGHWMIVYRKPQATGDSRFFEENYLLRVDQQNGQNSTDTIRGRFDGEWFGGEGISFIHAPGDEYLQAVSLSLAWGGVDNPTANNPSSVYLEYLPFAGGILPVEFSASNDWPELAASVCTSLSQGYGNGFNDYYCAPGALSGGTVAQKNVRCR